MPVTATITASAVVIIASALGIPVTALAVANPAPDSFTLVGAAMAVFCVVTFIKMREEEQRKQGKTGVGIGIYALLFNVLTTASIGWMAPELVAHYLLSAYELSNKAWVALAFFTGLSGGALVTACIITFRSRIPSAVKTVADKYLPGDDSSAPEGADTKQCRAREKDIFMSKPEGGRHV